MVVLNDNFISDIVEKHFIDKPFSFENEDKESKDKDNKSGTYLEIPSLVSHYGGIEDYLFLEKTDELIRSTLEKAEERFPKEYFEKIVFISNVYLQVCDQIFPYLRPIVAHNIYFEWLLYLEMDKRYRDHLTHQFRVACLGQWFIDKPQDELKGLELNFLKKIKDSSKIQNLCRDLSFDIEKLNEEDLKKCWWLSALFHDWGYLFKMYHKLESKVDDCFLTYNVNSLNNFDNLIHKDSFKTSLVYKFFEDKVTQGRCFKVSEIKKHCKSISIKKCKDHEKELDEIAAKLGYVNSLEESVYNLISRNLVNNHSVLGALNLLLTLEEMSKKFIIDTKTFVIFNIAAVSILTHDFDSDDKICGFDQGVNFEDYPLSFLLILCDQLQEWNRPVLIFKEIKSQDYELPEGEIKEIFERQHKLICFEEECKQIELKYFNKSKTLKVDFIYYKDKYDAANKYDTVKNIGTKKNFIKSKKQKLFNSIKTKDGWPNKIKKFRVCLSKEK